MNIAYFRKSTYDRNKTLENVNKHAKELGLTVLGSTQLPAGNGTILHICNPSWLGNLIASDANLLGLLPCTVAVIDRNDNVMIGAGSATVLGSVSQNPAIAHLALQVEEKLKKLVNQAAGVGPLKPTRIKLYSTTTCPYCKMEASWLNEKKVKFEEVHVDKNQKEAEEMVKKTGQMGVPVTAIQYEGGEEEYIVGFDKQRLSSILNSQN